MATLQVSALLDQVAARVWAAGSEDSGRSSRMAALITPSIALTAADGPTPNQQGASGGKRLELEAPLGPTPYRGTATITAVDPALGLALLALEPPAPLDLPPGLFAPVAPRPEEEWLARCFDS